MNIRTAMLLLVLALPAAALAFEFGVGGFSIGGGDPDEGGTSVDIGKVMDAVRHGRDAFAEVDSIEEDAMGRQAASVLLGAAPLLDNQPVQQYVNRVGRWLALHTERPDLTWQFGVLDTNDINAFAAPGGYIFISSGLLVHLRDEAELAAVLAHEMAHVLKRHHVMAIKKDSRAGLTGDLVSFAVDPSADLLYDVAVGTMKTLYIRGLDKDDEYQADRMGVVIAARAGYDPNALLAVLQTVDSMNPEDNALSLLLKTHPPASERLEKLDAEMSARMSDLSGGVGRDRFLQVTVAGEAFQ